MNYARQMKNCMLSLTRVLAQLHQAALPWEHKITIYLAKYIPANSDYGQSSLKMTEIYHLSGGSFSSHDSADSMN